LGAHYRKQQKAALGEGLSYFKEKIKSQKQVAPDFFDFLLNAFLWHTLGSNSCTNKEMSLRSLEIYKSQYILGYFATKGSSFVAGRLVMNTSEYPTIRNFL
jgi:hypothetical protein